MPISQTCFTDLSPEEQDAAIAQAFAAWGGVTVDLNCLYDDTGKQKFLIYDALLNQGSGVSSTAAGTAYTMTNAYASLDFGTTDPVITIEKAGVYRLVATVQLQFTGATYAALQSASFKLRRTNNTPADIGTPRSVLLPIMTTTTLAGPSVTVEAIYTAAEGDIITIQGILSAAPSAGTVTVTQAEINAIPA